jgi:hypothetical protein
MSSPDIFFGAGDKAPQITHPLKNPDGSVMDLTGRTVHFRYRVKNQSEDEVIETATILGDPSEGNALWTPAVAVPAGEDGLPRNYNADWIVDRGLPTQETVPNDRYLWMRVKPAP